MLAAATTTNDVIGWGDNGFGELGDGSQTSTTTPVQTRGLNGQILQVVAAGETSIALCRDCDPNASDTVWAWGDDELDQLGAAASSVRTCDPQGPTVPCSTQPIEVRGPSGAGYLNGIVRIAGSGSHVLAIDGTGAVWAWGDDSYEETGPGSTSPCPGDSLPCVAYPERMPGVHDVVDIAAGVGFSMAVERDGTVWGWGDNSMGALGQGTDGNNSNQYGSAIPLQVKDPKDPSGFLHGVIAVASSDHTTVIQRGAAPDGSQNTLWSWGGNNADGELGAGYLNSAGAGGGWYSVDLPQPVVTRPGGTEPFTGALALGQGGTLAVRFDASGSDTLWGWSSSNLADGGAGDFGTSARTTPRQQHASSGGDCNTPGPFLTGIPPDPRAVASGAAIIKQPGQSDGTVWLWGFNFFGPYARSNYPADWSYNCRFPVQAQGIAASAISVGQLDVLAVGQVLTPPPPTPTATAAPTPPPVEEHGPVLGAGPGTTPPHPGVPVSAGQPGGAPAPVSGQPPGPGGATAVGTAPAPGGGAAVAQAPPPAAAPGAPPATGVVSTPESASDSAQEHAMVRHDDAGAAAVLGLTAGAVLTLGCTVLMERRRPRTRPAPCPATVAADGCPRTSRRLGMPPRWDW